MPKKLLIFFAYAILGLGLPEMAAGGTILPPLSVSPIVFARNFFRAVNAEEPLDNMVISPAAVRSALTLLFMGAGGKTAEELRGALLLGAGKKQDIAKLNAELWSKECICNAKGVSMSVVSRIYVNDEQQLQPDFNSTAVEYFNATVEALDFNDADNSMQEINKWLELQTFHTVRNLLLPAAFNKETSVILVNTLFFRAKWQQRFALERTTTDDFWINPEQRMQLPMMRQVGQFRYGESKKLNAQLLQLPFEKSNISMLLIVPQDIDGLRELEKKLENFDLNEVAVKTLKHEVDVMLPKFKVECDLDLKMPAQKLGITQLFEPSADLSDLFAKKQKQLISEARHKLYLEVNETGCETDTNGTIGSATEASVNPERKLFKADRPFVFAIRNNKTVYFVGHFVKP